jgi:hypothetical protein
MADALNNAQHDFWRPPVVQKIIDTPAPLVACVRCGTEFIAGARFCHACGAARRPRRRIRLGDVLASLRVLEIQNLKRSLGLSTSCLAAFLVGIACLLGAVIVGFVYPAQRFSDFQAVQMWRMEWLLGAIAAFLAGVLFKSANPQQK